MTSRPVGGSLTFVGTATTLLRYGGVTILTDPNFLHRGERAYLGLGLSSRRLTEPALSVDDLPDVDFVLLSHHHGDHFDRRAAGGLDKRLPIVTGPHAATKLRSQRFERVHALTTWQTWTYTRDDVTVTVTSTPGIHAPGPLQRLIPPVMGSIVDFAHGGEHRWRTYVTGDTLLHPGVTEVAQRYAPIDLCVIHLGGTRVAGVLLTMDDRQGVEALRVVAPRTAVPVHYDDYTVFRSPLAAFRTRAEAVGLPTDIVYLDRGDSWAFTPA